MDTLILLGGKIKRIYLRATFKTSFWTLLINFFQCLFTGT